MHKLLLNINIFFWKIYLFLIRRMAFMSILIDENTRLIVQGITGRDGSFHTKKMKEYGTQVVGGVTPGKSGDKIDGIPVFDNMEEAIEATDANTSIVYVPPKFATDAIYEAVDSGIKLIVAITEGIPVQDMILLYDYINEKGSRLVGPNCPGLISPEKAKVGILPEHIFKKGSIGVVSRSGTLTYEVVQKITNAGFGQSTCIGIGGDPIIGTNFIDCLDLFEKDKQTEAVVLVGEIGGSDEEDAAQFIRDNIKKPVVSYIVGRTAPPGKRMGHAGAIIAGGKGTAEGKITALSNADVPVADIPSEIPQLLKEVI
jgi:succinyl-CoA synthetase alpha subunit